ncbi:rhomboid family intramembrane serine protease [bacterium]|nr:rhomboid family intramembrane serine protease [bacterium]MDY3020810.1 rhomboid family intramembrane serine protease [Oliverpabstia sp.]
MQETYGNDTPDALERIFQGPINWMNLLIVGVNILIFVLTEIIDDTENVTFMLKCGAAYTPWILEGQWYRLFTSMFLHFGVYHLLNNMVLLLFLGDMLEELTGKWRYLLIYLGGGLAGNIISLLMDCRSGEMAVSAGASGAVFAVIGGIFVILLKQRGRVKDLTLSRLVFVIFLSIYHGFQSTGIDNAAHVGGLLGGIFLTFLVYRRKNPQEQFYVS